jgi:hypothetical protein
LTQYTLDLIEPFRDGPETVDDTLLDDDVPALKDAQIFSKKRSGAKGRPKDRRLTQDWNSASGVGSMG